MRKPKVRLLFWGAPKGIPKWPNINFDPELRAKELKDVLSSRYPDIEFIDGRVIKNSDEAKEAAKEVGTANEDCVVIFHLASGWFSAFEIMKKAPTVVISDPYLWGYAGMIVHSADLRRKGIRGFMVSSSSWQDIDRAFRVIRAYVALKDSRIIVIGRHVLSADVKGYEEALKDIGIRLLFLDFGELRREYERVSEDAAEKLADEIVSGADKIIEPMREEVIKSTRLYYAIKNLCKKYGANGVTIDCLGGFYMGLLPAYPCIAFSLLDDEGEIMAACECDVDSLITKIAMKYISNRPGFISEPAIDTHRGVAVYAHCVAPTRMLGFDEEPEPYWIRSHAEDDKGATLQVLMHGARTVTITKVIPTERRILVLKGELLGHEEREGGCRTKAIVKVADAQALIDEWQHNWHRVLFYGDWSRELKWLAKLLGFNVYVERGSSL